MKKVSIAISAIIIFIIATAFSFKKESVKREFTNQPNSLYRVAVSHQDDADFIPGYGKSFLGFKEAIAFKESQGRYFITNNLGYIGKYQFGSSTLKTLKIHNTSHFLYNPKLQEKAFKANCSYNKWLLKDEIKKYADTQVNGIQITESGILAAAHLSGAGSVRKFLKRNGKGKRIVDAYGTTIEHYLKRFSGYNTTNIVASKQPKL